MTKRVRSTERITAVANAGPSIIVKMIASSAVLLALVIGLFGALTKYQGTRRLDASAERLGRMREQVQRAVAALEQCGDKDRCTKLKALDTELTNELAFKKRELDVSLRNVVVLGLLAVILGVLLNVVQSIKITQPIKDLSEKATQIADGDLDARVRVNSRDEIGQLGTRFNHMADQVVSLMQQAKYRVVVEKELEVVSAVQSSLVPESAEVNLDSVSLAALFQPAAQCGGDWWDYYRLDEDRLLVIIGDVTGHGAASAMITAAAKGAATATRELNGAALELPALLRAMNATIHAVGKGRFLMTCFASIYDAKTRTLEYANAGHVFPYLHQDGKLRPLVARGNRLGEERRSDFEVATASIEPNATIVWYTDGIVESEDSDGEKYGDRRFRKRIEMYAELSATHARNALMARAFEFFGRVAPKDDITMVIGRFS